MTTAYIPTHELQLKDNDDEVVSSYIENNLLEILRASSILSVLLQSLSNEGMDVNLSHVVAAIIESLSRAIEGNDRVLTYFNTPKIIKTPINSTHIYPRIHNMRELRELSYLELGEMIGVSSSCVEAWEDGTTIPGCNHLIPLANALNCDPLWLLTGEGQSHQGATNE